MIIYSAMRETIKLGQVSCDYVGKQEWLEIGRKWLKKGGWHHVVTLNPEMVIQAETDAAFRQAIMAADLRVPDGAGLIWAHWYLRSKFWPWLPSLLAFLWQPVERITGVDAVVDLAQLCAESKQPIYLLGGAEVAAQRVADWLRKKFPGLVVQVSPPHKFSQDGPGIILDHINQARPAVLLAAYGAPKQSEWISAHRNDLKSVVIAIGVGGAFDILSEALARAPKFLRQINMEWLWRLYLEPARGPRIWQAVVRFPLLVRKQKVSL